MKTAVADGLGDAGEVLVDDPASADIHVSNFGIAHLTGRQADGLSGGFDQYVRIVLPHAVPAGRVSQCNGVMFYTLAETPSVEDHQHQGFAFVLFGHGLSSLYSNLVIVATCILLLQPPDVTGPQWPP